MKQETIAVLPATKEEREWAAAMLADTEPWKALGVTIKQASATCNDPEYLVYIAHLEGRPCGLIVLDPRGVASAPYVKSILVDEQYRGRQVGAALMAFAEDLFKKKSRHLFLCVSSFNQKARAFYEALGYTALTELKDHIKEGLHEILMYKRIA